MFADIFVEVMTESKESMYKISKKTGIPDTLLSRYKNGKSSPSSKNLKILADHFNVTTDYLLTGKKESEEKLIIPKELEGVQVAFYSKDFQDLTQDEIDKLAEYARLIKASRGIIG